MDRRDFLKLISMIWMSCAPEAQAAKAIEKPRSNLKKRIIVIGAGMAGLSAARELQARGHDVLVIEARERTGGRIWTSEQWSDIPLDLGATWIHGIQGNPLAKLAKNIQTDWVLTSYDRSILYNTDGALPSAAQRAFLDQLRKQVIQTLQNYTGKDTSVQAVVKKAFLSPTAAAEKIRFINFVLSADIEQEYAGSADSLSAYWFDMAKAFQGDDAVFVHGYRVVTEYLAKGLTIALNQKVQEIHWQQTPLRVVTDKQELQADQILVTLPLGVLQAGSVHFKPALPVTKQTAIAKLGMGVLNKCYLRFEQAFWATDVDWLEYVPAKPGAWTEWVSFMRTLKLPILLGFNAADYGRAIEAWTDQQIVDSAMQTLRTIYGQAIPEPLDYQMTRWASDPFALGSYSFNPVGSTPAMRTELAKPLNGQVFFAGEASEKVHFSTAHGAYLSGLRAAKEMLAA